MQGDLDNVAQQAKIQGDKIDLTGCCYGLHLRTGIVFNEPEHYYYFLAGLVHSQRLCRILELGTGHGGSIMSMSRGIHKEYLAQSVLVTVDAKYKNQEGFFEYPHIRRIQGNVLDKGVVQQVTDHFDKDIDLIYIDSDHSYEHIKSAIDFYVDKLNPKYLVLDDITLNDSMKKLWSELTMKFGPRAFDASVISRRVGGAGFGLIQWRS